MDNEAKQSYKQSYTDNVELSIFNCGHEYCQPGHTWGPGVRDHYLIHLVVAGRGVSQVNGSSYTLQEGDLFLAKPNQLITYAADETDPWEYYWVGFNGACANKLVQRRPSRTLNRYTVARIPRPCGKRCTTSSCPAGRSPSARP